MTKQIIRIVILLVIIFVGLWLRFEGTKITVNNNGEYDFHITTNSIYPIRYQFFLTDKKNRKQYLFFDQGKRVTCNNYINADLFYSGDTRPVNGVFVEPACLRQYNIDANILIGSGINQMIIRISENGRLSQLHNPHLFVHMERIEDSLAYTLLKCIYYIMSPIAVIILIGIFFNSIRCYLNKE